LSTGELGLQVPDEVLVDAEEDDVSGGQEPVCVVLAVVVGVVCIEEVVATPVAVVVATLVAVLVAVTVVVLCERATAREAAPAPTMIMTTMKTTITALPIPTERAFVELKLDGFLDFAYITNRVHIILGCIVSCIIFCVGLIIHATRC